MSTWLKEVIIEISMDWNIIKVIFSHSNYIKYSLFINPKYILACFMWWRVGHKLFLISDESGQFFWILIRRSCGSAFWISVSVAVILFTLDVSCSLWELSFSICKRRGGNPVNLTGCCEDQILCYENTQLWGLKYYKNKSFRVLVCFFNCIHF